MKKRALLIGSKGNLGPVWRDELKKLRYVVHMNDESPRGKLGTAYDVVLYNAGVDNPPGSAASFFGNIDTIMGVNLINAILCAGEQIPKMVVPGGLFITVGSIQGRIGADWRNYPEGFEKPVAYNVSKAGLEQLTRSLAVQYGRYGIRAVTLAFGPVNIGNFTDDFRGKFTKNIPLGRFVSPDSMRAALRFAIDCPELTGQTIMIDGGYTVL